MESQLASEVARLKQTAIRDSARMAWVLGASLVAGVAVGLATWFVQEPRDRDDVHLSFALGLGLATFCLGGLFGRILFPRPKAQCPRCGYKWDASEGHDWRTWNHCPGCGLKINEDACGHDERVGNSALHRK
jgi:hypothetical protein